ncbi:hypothetical protein BGX26_001070 [Mortierella sp. AD094]|nr:hypothetical protein BGX26_001070 [Mortierella sp. AD094]
MNHSSNRISQQFNNRILQPLKDFSERSRSPSPSGGSKPDYPMLNHSGAPGGHPLTPTPYLPKTSYSTPPASNTSSIPHVSIAEAPGGHLLTPNTYHPRTSYLTLPTSNATSVPRVSITAASGDDFNTVIFGLDSAHHRSASMPSRCSTTSTASSYAPPRPFTDLNSGIPSMYLIAPSLERPTPTAEVFYQPFRLVIPCQGPSAMKGCDENAIHFTGHEGYLVKNPREFLHNHKQELVNINTIVTAIANSLSHAGQAVPNYAGASGNAGASTLDHLQAIAETRGHLNRAGIHGGIWAIHHIPENHQIWAMTSILKATAGTDSTCIPNGGLRGIVLKRGRIVWVCGECYDLLLTRRVIPVEHLVSTPEFVALTKQESSIDVVLRSSASVIIFRNTLSNSPDLESIKMEIKPEFFETKDLNSTFNLFKELGAAIKGCGKLRSLEIICHSRDERAYQGLKNVLECSKIEHLIVRGMKSLLEDPKTSIDCRSLRKLVLDGVLLSSEEAAKNLRTLIGRSNALTSLHVMRARITHESAVILSSSTPRDSRKQFERLVTLNLSDNDLESNEAMWLVELALGENKFGGFRESSKLRRLNLSNNPRIDDTCCREILAKFEKKSHPLETLNVQGTSIYPHALSDINSYLAKCKRT